MMRVAVTSLLLVAAVGASLARHRADVPFLFAASFLVALAVIGPVAIVHRLVRLQSMAPRPRALVRAAVAVLLLGAIAIVSRRATAVLVVAMLGALVAPIALLESARRRQATMLVKGALLSVLVSFAIGGLPFSLPTRRELAPPTERDVVVISWNLGMAPPDGGGANPLLIERVAARLRDADVACLQEVPSQAYLDRLLALLGEEWRGQMARSPLNKATAIVTRNAATFSQPLPSLVFGGPMLATIAGHTFACVHLPTWRAAERADAVSQIMALGTVDVILGDLNMDPESVWDRLLLSDDVARDRATLSALQRWGTDVGADVAPTGLLSRRIDALFTQPHITPVSVEVLLDSRDGLMDHRALRASLR